VNTTPTRQIDILKKWTDYLLTLSYVKGHFVEGSLVRDTGKPPNPASDIDMRIVVADDELDKLRDSRFLPILLPLQPYRVSVYAKGNRLLPLSVLGGYREVDYQFIRVITENGVVVDLDVYKESEAESMRSIIAPPEVTWKTTKTITPATVYQQTTDFTVVMAAIPSSFYNKEFNSTAFQLDLYHIDLIKLMYDVAGIDYARRYKHFTEFFPQEWLDDLDTTYADYSQKGLAYSMIALWKLVGKYMQLLSAKTGGGFDAEWYQGVYKTVRQQLYSFIK